STHPPITERIKILRAMQNGVHYLSYQNAFQYIKNSPEKILPASAALDRMPVAMKKPPLGWYAQINEKQSKRTSGDLIMQLNNYSFIDCVCGIKFKIPPEYKHATIKCPKCKTTHSIPSD